MSTFVLFGVALTAAFAVAVSLKAHFIADDLAREVTRLNTRLGVMEADLSSLAQQLNASGPQAKETEGSNNTLTLLATTRSQADPRVYVQLVPDQPHDRVILSNRSDTPARNVSLHLEFADGRTPFLEEFGATNFPVALLQQGAPYIVLADFRGGAEAPIPARLEWQDADGSPQVREFPLRWQ